MFTIQVQASCFSTIAEGEHSKISGDNCYFQHTALFHTPGWSIFCCPRVLKETRHSGKLNLWTEHVDTECDTINLRKWHVFCHYRRTPGLHMFPLLLLQQQTTQPAIIHASKKKTVRLRIETCRMQIKKKKKKSNSSLVLTLILLSISFLLFLPQVLPKGYFEIKVSVPAVCCA